MFELLKAGFSALQKGKQLDNKEAWKNVQLVTLFLVSLFTLVNLAFKLNVSEDIIKQLAMHSADLVALLLTVFGMYLTPATSTSVGLPAGNTPPPAAEPAGGTDAPIDSR